MKKAIRKALPWLLLVGIAAAAAAGLEGLLSIYIMKAVDSMSGGHREAFNQAVRMLLLISAGFIPALLLLALLRGLYKRSAAVSTRGDFIRRLFRKNINEFQAENNAAYVSVLTNDFNTIELNYIDGICTLLVQGMNFVVSVLVIGLVSPWVLLAGIGVGVVSTLLSALVSKPLQRHQGQRSELLAKYTAYIKEVLGAFHIIKSHNLEARMQSDYHSRSQSIQQKGYVIDRVHTLVISLNRLVMTSTFVGLVGITVLFGIKGIISVGGVILIVTQLDRLLQPIGMLGETLPKIFGVKKIFERAEDSLRNHDTHTETVTIDGIQNGLFFEDVSFSYGDHPVLDKVNLSLAQGGKYLLVGPSGGGKTTVLKLLRKYHSPGAGRIMLDFHDLRDVSKDSYFHQVANVEQQVFLFEDTVHNNLCLYKDYSDQRIQLALKQSGLEDFIAALPQGLNSMIYDNGRNISGGERSRLAIARALLAGADLIFLDEAFASLDAATASAIERTLLELDGVTVVNVSHVRFEENRHLYSKIFSVHNRTVQVA